MSKQRDLEFLFEVGAFRHIQRMWKRFLNPDFQNNAEHSFRVAWIALLIVSHEKATDQGKILKMALVHDLSESRTNDVDYIARQYVKRDEKQAINDIFKKTVLEDELIKIYQEYEKRETLEAKIVKDADNLDVELELREQAARGFNHQKVWLPQRKKAVYSRFLTKTGRRLWREIQKANPHDWHLKGRNRINAGDWKE